MIPLLARLLFPAAVVGFLLLYYLDVFLDWPWTQPLRALLGVICYVLALLTTPLQRLTLVLLLLTGALLAWRFPGAVAVLHGFRELEQVLAMVLLVPLVGRWFRHRDYAPVMAALARRYVRSDAGLFTSIAFLVQTIGAVVTFTGIIIVHQVLRDMVSQQRDAYDRFLSIAMLRGFQLHTLWSPNAPAFAVALQFTGAALLPAMGWGLLLMVVGLAVVTGVAAWERRGEPSIAALLREEAAPEPAGSVRLAREFFIVSAGMVLAVIVIEQATFLTLLETVPLVTSGFTVLAFLLSGALRALREHVVHYAGRDLNSMRQQAVLFFTAGLLIMALRQTGAGALAFGEFAAVIDRSPLGIVPGLTLLVVLLGMMGIPPIPASLLLAGTLDPALLKTAPEFATLGIAIGASLSLIMSPITVPLLVFSAMTGRDTITLGMRWNWRSSLVLFVVFHTLLWLVSR